MKFSHSHITVFLLTSVILLMSGGFLSAQNVFVPDPESQIWIEGESNVNQFACQAERYDGSAQVDAPVTDLLSIPRDRINIEVKIAVDSFECGRSRMNRDLYDALNSEQHQFITFQYKSAETLGTPTDLQGKFELEVTGDLTVAGTTREIIFRADGYFTADARMRVLGKKEIRMTDFGVEPPTGLLGLIKAKNELTVHFDLYARPSSGPTDTTQVIEY